VYRFPNPIRFVEVVDPFITYADISELISVNLVSLTVDCSGDTQNKEDFDRVLIVFYKYMRNYYLPHII
jgi:hypothetical protein